MIIDKACQGTVPGDGYLAATSFKWATIVGIDRQTPQRRLFSGAFVVFCNISAIIRAFCFGGKKKFCIFAHSKGCCNSLFSLLLKCK